MGRLSTALNLPKRIFLKDWGATEFSTNPNILLSFTFILEPTPLDGSIITYSSVFSPTYPAPQKIYFRGSYWDLRDVGDNSSQWFNNSSSPILPLTGWERDNAQGPAGTITPILTNTKNISIKKQNLGGGRLLSQKSPIIEDILQTQVSTIGQLHYNINRRDGQENKPIRTIFGNSSGGSNGSNSHKVVRNEIQNSWNRINYNMNNISASTQLSNFTVVFDARVNGTADGYGFYWYAKGTYNVNTPQNYAVCTDYPCEEGACLDSRCEEYNECYEFDQDGYCIDYDECYSFACLDFDCWTRDYTSCQGSVVYSNWDSFPDRGGDYGNRPDNDSYVVFFDHWNNRLRSWWGAGDPISSYFGSSLGQTTSISSALQNPGSLRDGKWRKHKIQYFGNTIRVFIDDKLHLTVVDSSPGGRDKSGRNFGLYGGVGGSVAFHEFRNFKFYDYIR